jgi:hypothetical protein
MIFRTASVGIAFPQGLLWRLVPLEQAMLVTKWGSLQDTFVMDAATHPLEKFPIWND